VSSLFFFLQGDQIKVDKRLAEEKKQSKNLVEVRSRAMLGFLFVLFFADYFGSACGWFLFGKVDGIL
jgi:hypothetical protein